MRSKYFHPLLLRGGRRRRTIRAAAKHFVLEHGVLYRIFGERGMRWVPEVDRQRDILQPCHSHATKATIKETRHVLKLATGQLHADLLLLVL